MTNLAGIAVCVSATDGTVASSILVGKPFDFSPLTKVVFVDFAELLSTLTIILGIILVLVGMIKFVNKRNRKNE
jgi:hypothetical protein